MHKIYEHKTHIQIVVKRLPLLVVKHLKVQC
jgi:hypothetical protein